MNQIKATSLKAKREDWPTKVPNGKGTFYFLLYPSLINDEVDELVQLLKKKIPDKNTHSHSESAV